MSNKTEISHVGTIPKSDQSVVETVANSIPLIHT